MKNIEADTQMRESIAKHFRTGKKKPDKNGNLYSRGHGKCLFYSCLLLILASASPPKLLRCFRLLIRMSSGEFGGGTEKGGSDAVEK